MTTKTKTRTIVSTCDECGFTSTDYHLVKNHSCDIEQQGGRCEDYPCCGHEWGDCNGQKYGSDEAIKDYVYQHSSCDHEAGIYDCANLYDEEEGDDGD